MKKAKNTIVRSTVVLTIFSTFIKFLGLIKQATIASYCGATIETDAFFISTGILVQLCVVIFSAISISLLTLHTDTLVKEGRKKSNELINGVLQVFIPISIGITIVFFAFAPVVAKLFAPAYKDNELIVLSRYIRIMSCSFILWCYFLILNVILETDKEFIPGKGQAFFQNLFLILAAIFLSGTKGIDSLVYGFLLSGLAECILVTWCVKKRFNIIFRKINVSDKIRRLISLSFPLIVGSAIYEINDIVDKQISSGLGEGQISCLTYGGTINDIVTGVIVTSVSTVLFSHFTTMIVEGNIKNIEITLSKINMYLIMAIFPIMVLCIGAGDQIVSILYGRGNFQHENVMTTYGVVVGYAVGFIFQSVRSNLVKVFYAFQDTKRPMINGAISVTTNILLSFILSKYFGVAGVALATSIAMILVTILLLKDIKKYLPDYSIFINASEYIKGMISAILVTALLYFMRNNISGNEFYIFVGEAATVLITYIVLLLLLRSRCIYTVIDMLKKNQKRID